MNEALAQWEASTAYSAPADVDTVMQVLANAGYNTEHWTCLTEGYQVYWYKNNNRMILYNSKTAEIEYPDEYVGTKTMVSAANNFFIYNYNHVKAQQFDMSITSHISSDTVLSGASSLSSAISLTTKDSGLNTNESTNVSKIQSAITSNNAISNALLNATANKGTSGTLHYYATREVVSADSGNAYASLQVSAVGTEENPVTLQSNGKLVENLYYITIVNNNGSETEIKAAQKAAGEYVYNIFDQITTGKVTPEAVIVLDGGIQIDCSTCEWAPCKTFTGYFGTTDDSNPVVINGARLTYATGHSSTVAFNGSGSKYFVTGFFGTIYGETTIENVVFRNIQIASPATDYELTESDRGSKLINTRNTVGIIGGITDGFDSGHNGETANVVIRNVTVESSCSVTGAGCVGGLVGYIGSANSAADSAKNTTLAGTITIDNCAVHCDVTSTDSKSGDGYKAAGGIVGFACRVDSRTIITLKDCTFDAKLNGYGCLGAAIGALQNGPTAKFEGTINLASANLNQNATAKASRSLVGYIENFNNVSSTATLNLIPGLNMSGASDGTSPKDLEDGVWVAK